MTDDQTQCPFCKRPVPVGSKLALDQKIDIPSGSGSELDLLFGIGAKAVLLGNLCTCVCGTQFLVNLIAVLKGPNEYQPNE